MATSGADHGARQERDAAREHDAPRGGASREDVRHRRALVLSEVAAEGTAGLSRVLRRALADDDAAAIPVSALVRAVPGMTALDGYEVMVRAHIGGDEVAGDLSPGQRVALLELVRTTDHMRRDLGRPPTGGT
jgi:hypothetical protein